MVTISSIRPWSEAAAEPRVSKRQVSTAATWSWLVAY
jgi:hypothetical protein